MPQGDPRIRILDAAERLFADQGLKGFSLRAVTELAGMNLAAVNYYFGSKDELIYAMTQRHFSVVTSEQLSVIAALEQQRQSLTVRAVVAAYAQPVFHAFDAPQAGEWIRAWMSVIGLHPAAGVYGLGENSPMVSRRFYEVLRGLLLDLAADELWWRWERMHALLISNQGRRHGRPENDPSLPPRDQEREWLLTLLVGALTTAPTP